MMAMAMVMVVMTMTVVAMMMVVVMLRADNFLRGLIPVMSISVEELSLIHGLCMNQNQFKLTSLV